MALTSTRLYDSLSQYGKAIDYYQQALPIYRSVGDRNGEAKTLNNLRLTYPSLLQYSKAIDYYQQALPIYRSVGDRNGEGVLLGNIGYLLKLIAKAAESSPDSTIEVRFELGKI